MSIKLKHIVSCSNEDPAFPAKNLLNSEAFKKWRCQPGAKCACVVVQLEKSSRIRSVDLGNDHSAFVEVLVGRETDKQEDYQVLVPASSLMNPNESRQSQNPNRVRMIGPETLTPAVARQNWDRVKLVCSQPFNKTVGFGLAFVRLASESEERPSSQTTGLTLGRFNLRPDDDAPALGDLFSKRKTEEKKPEETKTTPVPIRAAIQKPEKAPPPAKKPKREASTQSKDAVASGKEAKNVPFEQLLKGVGFALSGFQNPLRGELREKGKAMGGEYFPDWTPACSHLICAYHNTPKAQKVRGQGKLVKKDWLLDCHKYKKKLSWRKYALDKKDAEDSDSEEELLAQESGKKGKEMKSSDAPSTSKRPQREAARKVEEMRKNTDGDSDGDDAYTLSTDEDSTSDTDMDTDEELEKVKAGKSEEKTKKKKKRKAPAESEEKMKKGSLGESEDKASLAVGEDGLPVLPDFFSGHGFFLFGEFGATERKQLKRFVTAFGGRIEEYMGEGVTHVLTRQDWDASFTEAAADKPQLVFARPDWVLDSGRKSMLLDVAGYLVEKK